MLLMATAMCTAMPRNGDSEQSMLRELGPEMGKIVLPDEKVLYTFDRGTVMCQYGRVIQLNISSDAEVLKQKQLEIVKKREEAQKKAEVERKSKEILAEKLIRERKAAEVAQKVKEAEEAKIVENVRQFDQLAKSHINEIISRRIYGLSPKGFGISKVNFTQSQDGELCIELNFNNQSPVKITKIGLKILLTDEGRDEVAFAGLIVPIPSDNQVGFSILSNFRVDVSPTQGAEGRIAEAATRCAKLKAIKNAKMIVFRIISVEPASASQAIDIQDSGLWLIKQAEDGPRVVDNRPDGGSDKPFAGNHTENANYGSGMVFSNEGYLFTNHHVVDGTRACYVLVDDGTPKPKRLSAIVIATDKEKDLAILKVEGWTPPKGAPSTPPSIAPTSTCKMGDSIFVLGYPLPGTLSRNVKYTKGDISDLSGIENNTNEIQHTAPIQPGNSGGPMCLADGRVVGIVVSSLSPRFALNANGALPQGVNFSVKSNCLLKLADKAGIKIESTSMSSDPVGHVKAYTVQLMCTK